jgi:hypothetical protein
MIREADANTTPWSYAGATGGIDNSATAVAFRASAGAGLRNYITDIQISHATLGAATELAIRDGAAGTVLWRMTLNTVANENISVSFKTPLVGTAATLLEVVTLTGVTGDVIFNAQGFSAP